MRLPHRARAVVDERKVIGYLLSTTHPFGRHKARFFRAVGFARDHPATLTNALRAIARQGVVRERVTTAPGVQHIVDGWVRDGRAVAVPLRTVWVVNTDDVVPRFVTAFPKRSGSDKEDR